MKLLITGGAGFIGSHVVKHFVLNYPEYEIFNLDKLTYAGNLENLIEIEERKNYNFIYGDICDKLFIDKIFKDNRFDVVIHLAAESHVDNSILNPIKFAQTNILGTLNLLNSFKESNSNFSNKLFYHVSTDEVYGSLGEKELFKENSRYKPNSPYSASKASSDHFVRAYGKTYDLPFIISNCSNNYGPYQFPEKLIPLFISNIINKKSLPVYGDGSQIRDWLYVEDHAKAIDMIIHSGKIGETYNIGGNNEWRNLDLVKELCRQVDRLTNGNSSELITFIKDRAGHDYRYAIDNSKIINELGWNPSVTFEQGLKKTIEWYFSNKTWINNINTLKYQELNKKYLNQ